MRETAARRDAFLDGFAAFERGAAARGPLWLQRLRRRAIERFEALGFPSVHDEDWRQTSVASIAGTLFHPVPQAEALARSFTLEQLPISIPRGGTRLVFVDGWFDPSLSSADGLPWPPTAERVLSSGLRVAALAWDLVHAPERLESALTREAAFEERGFTALNTAFFTDGAVVQVPDGAVVLDPISIVYVSTAPERPTVTFPRTLIVLGAGSQAVVLESYAGRGGGPAFTNAVTEIVVGPGAVLDHCRIVEEGSATRHVATLQARQERASTFRSCEFCLGAALTRVDLGTVLAGEGAECVLDGLYLADGSEHVDNHTELEHAAPHCPSRELYKGILSGSARAVFNGRIHVRPAAQKTDAKQSNKNLLLSDSATVYTRPQLEIYANDVKCTHGATIGRLDADAVFYLRARGLGRKEAEDLLVHAFAGEIVERVPVASVREGLDRTIAGRLTRMERSGPGDET